MSDYLDINNEELLKDFFSEAEQQVFTLESNILVIENDPANHDAIDEIFRAAHTLKGGSATVEMHELSGFTHVMEDLLDVLRSGALAVSEPVVDILLKSLDVIKAMLSSRASGSVYGEDVSELKGALEAMIPAKEPKAKGSAKKPAPQTAPAAVKPAKTAPQAAEASPVDDIAGLLSEYELLELREAVPSGQGVFVIKVPFDESNPMNTVGGIQVFASIKQVGQVLKTIPDFDALYEDIFHETVMYFVSSDADSERLSRAATISDVTLAVSVSRYDLKSMQTAVQAPSSAPAAKAAVAPAAPAAPAQASAPVKSGDAAALSSGDEESSESPAEDTIAIRAVSITFSISSARRSSPRRPSTRAPSSSPSSSANFSRPRTATRKSSASCSTTSPITSRKSRTATTSRISRKTSTSSMRTCSTYLAGTRPV